MTGAIAAQPFPRVDIQLRTKAGTSHKGLAAQFSSLFAQCGLPSEFEWDEKYVVTPLWKRDEFEPSEDHRRADANKAQKAMQELLEKMDPVSMLILAHASFHVVRG